MIDNRTRRSNSFYRRFPFLKSRKLQNKFNEMYFQHFKTYPLNVSFIKWVYLIVNLCGIYIVSYFLWPFWQKIFLVVIEFIHLNLFFFLKVLHVWMNWVTRNSIEIPKCFSLDSCGRTFILDEIFTQFTSNMNEVYVHLFCLSQNNPDMHTLCTLKVSLVAIIAPPLYAGCEEVPS